MTAAVIRYTDDMPEAFGGMAYGPYIAIRPKYRDDMGIHAHELEHVKQWWVVSLASALAIGLLAYAMLGAEYVGLALLGFAVHPVAYKLVSEYRLHCEIEAYRQQAKHYPGDRMPLFAGYIAEKYGLPITPEVALKLLIGD